MSYQRRQPAPRSPNVYEKEEVDTIAENTAQYFRGVKNYIINGAFNVWQRGTGAFTGSGYNADRTVAADAEL